MRVWPIFVALPIKIELTLKGVSIDTTRRFVFHSLQLIPWKSIRNTEYQKYFSVTGNDCYVTRIPVVAGVTMEVTLAQFWSSLGSSTVS
jgi:tripeptidyl-peptidase-2